MKEQSVKVPASTRNIEAYEYSRKTRTVTFTCIQCGSTVTQERFPGPTPSYCGDACRLLAAAYRKRKARALTGKNQGLRGRPRKTVN